jgi:hypothetical protein
MICYVRPHPCDGSIRNYSTLSSGSKNVNNLLELLKAITDVVLKNYRNKPFPTPGRVILIQVYGV